MYPILWEPFGYPISTFGVMMALGFLAATCDHGAPHGRDRPRSRVRHDHAPLLHGRRRSSARSSTTPSTRGSAPARPARALLLARRASPGTAGLIGGDAGRRSLGCQIHGLSVRLVLHERVAPGRAVGPGPRPDRLLPGRRRLRAGDGRALGRRVPAGSAADPRSGPPDPALRDCSGSWPSAALLWRRRRAEPLPVRRVPGAERRSGVSSSRCSG